MKYLKIILLIVIIVNDYVSLATKEKMGFHNMTFTEFKQACKNKNHRLTEARKITNKLRDDFTGNCTDSNHQKKIKDLVNEILPCLDKNSQPNEAELKTIYKEITTKLCIHYEYVNFKRKNENCFKTDDLAYPCLYKNFKTFRPEFNKLFSTLAMTHSHQECNFIKLKMACLSNRNETDCAPQLKIQRDNIIEKYASNLKCA
ncbi:uncharacterized protein LOC127286297 isoform X3 [Leptopilina boulardi]|uniref:uncharacterized protein LOC127286297 isoform X3 n=1 Tax=Leptopilina boulardi TaxID=63433 RepID=UPI0021F64033|nr:uncharacterized protein LOC127286297 isoform X3 [Leptopilina boulardi]